MQIISNDYFELDFVLAENGGTRFISSEDATSCEFIKSLLNDKMFENNLIVFKASGLYDNLKELIIGAELSGMNIFDGDAKKIIVKNYPECYGVVSKEQVDKILDEWTCTIYEKRFLISVKTSKLSKVLNLLHQTVYRENFLEIIWPYVDLVIENAADAPNHNSFIVHCKKEYNDRVHAFLMESNGTH